MASKSKKRKLSDTSFKVLTDQYLNKLAKQIPEDYHSILVNLHLDEQEIKGIEQDYTKVTRRAYEGFRKWQKQCQGQSEHDMLKSLKLALNVEGRVDLEQDLDKEIERFNDLHRDKEKDEDDNGYIENEKGSKKRDKKHISTVHGRTKIKENNSDDDDDNVDNNDNDHNDDDDDEDTKASQNEKYEGDEDDHEKVNNSEKEIEERQIGCYDDGEKEVSENDDDSDENGDDDDDDDNDDDDDDNDDDDEDDNDEKDDSDDEDDDSDDDDSDNDEDDRDDDDDEIKYLPIDKCIVAGIKNEDQSSSLLSMTSSKKFVNSNVRLKVTSKTFTTYRQKKITKYRLDMTFTDGVTFMKGVAFEEHAKKVNNELFEGHAYVISDYKVMASNTIPSYKEIHVYKSSNISLQDSAYIETPKVKVLTIKDVKHLKPINQLVVLNPVVVCAVSKVEKPKKKYLRKVLLKDETERIMFQIWYEEDCKVKFEYKKGDTVQATFVEVGEFGGDIHLTHVGATKMVKEDTNMLELLIGENCEMFTDKPLSIEQICQLPFSQETATLNEVQVVTFKKNQESDLVYRACSIVQSHGKLIRKANKLYCEKCSTYLNGNKKVLLNAEIKDKYDHRTWITIFDQCAKVILSKSYDTFLDCSHNERVSILKEIEHNEDLYFDLKVKKDQCNKIIAKKVKIIE